jgi:hypothetical protein
MVEKETISVIIVNFNGGDLLLDCVHSVLASTVPVNLYLIDNASKDNSLHRLQLTLAHDHRIRVFKNADNLGFARAANLAIPYIRDKYLLFLNPDCLLRQDTLEQFVKVMEQDPQAGMAGGLVRNPDGSEQAGCRRSVPTPWRAVVRVFHLDKIFPQHPRFQSFVLTKEPLPNQPIELEGISGACMFVRRLALEEVGLMDEAYFLHCEDLDWFMRFREKRWKILFIPTIEIVHVKGVCSQGQPLRVLWYKHRGMVRFYQKFFRQRYPWWVWWGVVIAVWLRFAILASIMLVKI